MSSAAHKTYEYDLKIEERNGYLYASISAELITRDMALDYLSEVLLQSAKKRYKRILIERNIPDRLRDADIFAVMKRLVQMSPDVRLAFVNKNIPIHEAMDFAIELGRSAGSDYKYFSDVSLAEKWLLE